jgi:hypothetical protein
MAPAQVQTMISTQFPAMGRLLTSLPAAKHLRHMTGAAPKFGNGWPDRLPEAVEKPQ